MRNFWCLYILKYNFWGKFIFWNVIIMGFFYDFLHFHLNKTDKKNISKCKFLDVFYILKCNFN